MIQDSRQTSGQQTSLHAQEETKITSQDTTVGKNSTFTSLSSHHPRCPPASHQRPRTARINQRIPLRNAKQQTNIPPRNERTTRKLASLSSAKRSVVTSDATGTHSPSNRILSEITEYTRQRAVQHKRTARIAQVQTPSELSKWKAFPMFCCEIQPIRRRSRCTVTCFSAFEHEVRDAQITSEGQFLRQSLNPRSNQVLDSSNLSQKIHKC